MPLRIERRTQQAFAWIAVIPVMLVLIALWSRGQYRASVQRATRSRQVLAAVDDVLLGMTRAETGQRGFILTGEDRYLAGFDSAQSEASAGLRDLRTLIGDHRPESSQVDRLQQLAEEKMTELRQTIALRRSGSLEGALKIVHTHAGQELMAAISAVAMQMTANEERILAERQRAQRAADIQVNTILLAGIGATPALLIWAGLIIRRYARARDRAEFDIQLLNRELQARVDEVDRLNRDLENRVEERTASLKRSNDDLRQFAYVASHDLQEPLRMVGSYVGLLARRYEGKFDAEADLYIRYAVDGAKRMQILINDLLAYSRAGTHALSIAPTRMGEVVQEVLETMQTSIGESQAMIEVGELPEAGADRIKIGLVFQNLMANAIRFRKPGERPRIRIAAEPNGSAWRFSVQDYGIGFDPKYSEKIFVIFQRLHGAGKYPGTGIGLAVAKRIVEGHHGRIWAESTPGEGATFYFTLPAAAQAAGSNASARAVSV